MTNYFTGRLLRGEISAKITDMRIRRFAKIKLKKKNSNFVFSRFFQVFSFDKINVYNNNISLLYVYQSNSITSAGFGFFYATALKTCHEYHDCDFCLYFIKIPIFIEKKLHKIRKSRKFIPREIHFSS